jgi:hypothetical protein
MRKTNDCLALSPLASLHWRDLDPMPMSKQPTRQLRTQLIGFGVSALVAFVIFGTAAWWWTRSPGTALPDGPVYMNGRVVGSAVGVRSVGAGRIQFAEIADADAEAMLRFGRYQYGEFTFSISTIQIVHYPQTGSRVRLLRVTAQAE